MVKLALSIGFFTLNNEGMEHSPKQASMQHLMKMILIC